MGMHEEPDMPVPIDWAADAARPFKFLEGVKILRVGFELSEDPRVPVEGGLSFLIDKDGRQVLVVVNYTELGECVNAFDVVSGERIPEFTDTYDDE